MEISILLHIYQPPWQFANVVHDISNKCYLPLVKLIKAKKDFKVTLNCPLSLLEWFEKEKIESFTADIKVLREKGSVELVGSAAYHPILTKIPENEVYRQIILNESGLGFYFGRREGFEGEPSMLIKNLKGFFPPELAFNKGLGAIVSDLGYEWVVLDVVSKENTSESFSDSNEINKLSGTDLNVCFRNRDLSLCLAYKRDSDPKEFLEGLSHLEKNGAKFAILVLDGETFGHQNPEGMDLLENIIDAVVAKGHKFELISNVVKVFATKKEVSVVEASWAASDQDMKDGNIYPKWYIHGNTLHEKFEELETILLESLNTSKSKVSTNKAFEQAGNLPVWDFNKVSISSELSATEKSWLKARVLLDKALNSDKYWWSSEKPEYDIALVKRSLELFVRAAEKLSEVDSDALRKIKGVRDEILSIIKS